jgi:hypothetical protein
MDRKIALKWAKALESGKYIQGDGALRTNYYDDSPTEFCCLGVLCNLHAIAHPEIAATQEDENEYLGEQAMLPEEVMLWAGMSSTCGDFNGREIPAFPTAASLIDVNDSCDGSFTDIAKIIRKHSAIL